MSSELDPTVIQCDFGEWADQQCPRIAERFLVVQQSPPGTGTPVDVRWRLCAGHAATMREQVAEDQDASLMSDEPLT